MIPALLEIQVSLGAVALADAASFVLSAALIALIHAPARAAGSPRAAASIGARIAAVRGELGDGLRRSVRHRVVRALTLFVLVTSAGEGIRATLTDALQRGRRLDLVYDTATRDETTSRQVDPLRLFVLDGFGYLEAWCHRAQGLRTFRLDRIVEASVSDLAVEAHDDVAAGHLDDRLHRATDLHLPPLLDGAG